MKREIERYMELMKERPEEFVNSGMIEIEKDPEKIALAAEKLDRSVGGCIRKPVSFDGCRCLYR